MTEGRGLLTPSLSASRNVKVEVMRAFGPAMFAPLQTSGRGVGRAHPAAADRRAAVRRQRPDHGRVVRVAGGARVRARRGAPRAGHRGTARRARAHRPRPARPGDPAAVRHRHAARDGAPPRRTRGRPERAHVDRRGGARQRRLLGPPDPPDRATRCATPTPPPGSSSACAARPRSPAPGSASRRRSWSPSTGTRCPTTASTRTCVDERVGADADRRRRRRGPRGPRQRRAARARRLGHRARRRARHRPARRGARRGRGRRRRACLPRATARRAPATSPPGHASTAARSRSARRPTGTGTLLTWQSPLVLICCAGRPSGTTMRRTTRGHHG